MNNLSVNLINAIPSILQFVEETADIEAICDEQRDFKHVVNMPPKEYFLMAFPYSQMVEYAVGDGEVAVLIRDVVNLPEFQQRLGNILGIPNRVFCEVHEVVRDFYLGDDGLVEQDDAVVTFTFTRWNNHPLRKKECLFVAHVDDPNEHAINRYGVCHCCGAFQ